MFSEPIIAADLLSEEVLSEWFPLSLTIEDWTTRFRSAASVGARQAEVTPLALQAQQDFASRAESFQTPNVKRKRESLELPAAIGISPYKRKSRGEEDFAEKDLEETLQHLVELVLGFGGGLDETSSALVKLLIDFHKNASVQELTSKMLEHKLETIKMLLGSKPVGLSPDLDVRSAWGTIAAIASKMKDLENAVAKERLASLAEKAASDIRRGIWEKTSTLNARMDELKNT